MITETKKSWFSDWLLDRIDGFTSFFEKFMDRVGHRIPAVSYGLMGIVGHLLFAMIDIIAGGIALSWAISFYAQPQDRIIANVLGWFLSIAMYWAISSVSDRLIRGEGWARSVVKDPKKLFLLVLAFVWNCLDSLIDGSCVFILFGITSQVVLGKGIEGFIEAFSQLPAIGWITFVIIASISFFAEPFRQLFSESGESASNQRRKRIGLETEACGTSFMKTLVSTRPPNPPPTSAPAGVMPRKISRTTRQGDVICWCDDGLMHWFMPGDTRLKDLPTQV